MTILHSKKINCIYITKYELFNLTIWNIKLEVEYFFNKLLYKREKNLTQYKTIIH